MKKHKKTVLFIHPLGVNWMPGEKDMSRIANIMLPIGILSLAAWVEKRGHQAFIHDCYAFPMQDEEMLRVIRDTNPDYLGISATTSSFLDGIRISKKAKEVFPHIKTVFGGIHVSALGEKLLRDFPEIDYGVVGEGEESLVEILERDEQDFKGVRGVIYRENGQVVFTGPRATRLDLDALPFPAYHKVAGFPVQYKLPIFNYPRVPNTTAMTSRGCPYQCSYCDRSVFGPSFRFNSAEYMFELVKFLNKQYGIRHINFYDDVFTLHPVRLEGFCKLLIDSGMGMTFNCAARAEHLDSDLVKLMKRAGCWMISLGIESGDHDLLERHRANADLEMIRHKVELIKNTGIRPKGLFMLGLPGETEQTIDRSMEYALSLPLDDFNLTKFTPFPGSPVYQHIREYGQFEEKWELMNCLNFVFIPHGFTRERLEERYREFYRRYFQRPRILWSYATMLWRSPDSWLRFLTHLGDFLHIRNTFKK